MATYKILRFVSDSEARGWSLAPGSPYDPVSSLDLSSISDKSRGGPQERGLGIFCLLRGSLPARSCLVKMRVTVKIEPLKWPYVSRIVVDAAAAWNVSSGQLS